MSLLPATHTKQSKFLTIPIVSSVFQLAQSDDGVSNGTALWLGAQCLSAYLTHSAVIKPGAPSLNSSTILASVSQECALLSWAVA